MKIGTKVKIVWMPKDKEEFIGMEGVITSWKPCVNHVGIRLDSDFREIALMKFQIAKM